MLPILSKDLLKQRLKVDVIVENNKSNLLIEKNPNLDSNDKKNLYKIIKEFDKAEDSIDKEFYDLWKSKNADSKIDQILENWRRLGSILYILRKDNNITGFCVVRFGHPFLKNIISITDIGISKNARGQGLGKYLFKYVIDDLEKNSDNNIILNVFDRNNIAKKMYSSFGFRPATTTMVKFR